MTMDLKVETAEGMKIAPKDNQKKEYTLIISSVDNSMYGVYQSEVIKLEDEDMNNYICTDLSAFSEEVKVLETEDKKLYLADNDFCIHTFIMEQLHEDDEDFQSVDMRILKMSREEYLNKIYDDNYYFFKVREIVHKHYKKDDK